MEKLIHAIYLSQAAPEFSEHETLQMLRQARTANRKHDVSGMMLYMDGHFLQLLEGSPTMVDLVSSALFRDKRKMFCILREPIAEREFPEWTMGFEVLSMHEAADIIGTPLSKTTVSERVGIDAASATTLLSIIGRRRWQADRSGMFWAIRRSASRKEPARGDAISAD